MNWEMVIGLEIHAQLSTQSKLFSSAPTRFGALPNTQVSLIDAGLPGVLPVLNQQAVYMAVQFGFAINAVINNDSYFERKNYFYPDLPKGYQISQFQRPIVENGQLEITTRQGSQKMVSIVRAHLEEDAGKSIHDAHATYSGIDLNRAGTPLLEIVTAPCLYSADEAISTVKTLHQLLRFLGICDGNMQEGSFRCDVNLSLRPAGQVTLGTRTELKNINSFRFIEKAIHYERSRHEALLEAGEIIHQETRLYNPDLDRTESLRGKENENDYRYFPDPDLLPIHLDTQMLEQLKKALPPLPQDIAQQLTVEDGLAEEHIEFLLTSPALFQYYQAVRDKTSASPKLILNWLKGSLMAAINDQGLCIENSPISSEALASLLTRVADNTLSNNNAKKLFSLLLKNQDLTQLDQIDTLIQREELAVGEDSSALDALIQNLVQQFPEQTADYRAGKEKLFGFFVGQVMKATEGKANPAVVSRLLKQYLV